MTETDKPGGSQADSLIRFACSFCGQHIRIPKIHAGKKGKCPKCGKTVLIPPPPAPKQPQEDEPLRLKRDDPPPDIAVPVPVPEQSWHRGTVNPADTVTNDFLKTEPPPEKKPATILTVFAFPFSVAGIIHYLLFWLGPFILAFFARVFAFVCYGQLLIFGLYIALLGYFYYYISSCIVAAAKDERTAPDVTNENPPGFFDLLRRLFLVIGSLLVCFGPLLLYLFFAYIRPGFRGFWANSEIADWRGDPLYWLLYGFGIFVFPMLLLAIAMFDSLMAYNPVLIIGSIISTHVYYCVIVLLFCVIGLIMNYVGRMRTGMLPLFAWGINIYLIIIASYILGRFYRRYEEKLSWEIKL